MDLTLWQLHQIMPKLPMKMADLYLSPLNHAMREWDITTPQKQAAFLACLAAHSKQLRRWRDSGTGEGDEFSSVLGNFLPGDGRRFKAGGPFPIVGRAMYSLASRYLPGKYNLCYNPNLITKPEVGLLVAAWLWAQHHKCNRFVDRYYGTEEGLWWCHWKLLGVGRWDRHKKLKGWKAVRDAWNRAKRVLDVS
jgi:putative chitinase